MYADGINQYCKLSFIQRSTKIDPLTPDILRTNCCVINFSLSTPSMSLKLLCSAICLPPLPVLSPIILETHFYPNLAQLCTFRDWNTENRLFMQSCTCLNVSNYLSIQNMHVFCNQQLHIFFMYIPFSHNRLWSFPLAPITRDIYVCRIL